MALSSRSLVTLAILTFLPAPACHNYGGGPTFLPPGEPAVLEIFSGDDQTGGTGQELSEPLSVRVLTQEGEAAADVTVRFEVTAGGGSLSTSTAVTDMTGIASVGWTLGAPPVWNRVRAEARGNEVDFNAWAEPGTPPELDLVYEAPAGASSEDLAFWPGRGLFLGSPGAILHAAAPGTNLTELILTGEEILGPVGITFGPAGDLYACEHVRPECASVKRIAPSGACTIISDGYEGDPFALPNYMAVDGSGEIYLSASCADMIYRISPLDGETEEFLSIPGPNGLAFDDDYDYLYITNENPALFCSGPFIPAGLFRVAIGPDGEPGEIETLVDGFAIAGDGLAFDMEGNLYAVFTGIQGCGGMEGLLKSGVFVYSPDGRFSEFFSVDMPGDIITNIAFGADPFDPYSLYGYGFTGRLYRAEVGIEGQPLP